MGKYDKYNPQSRMAERPWKIHPVWRGIGCLMMILIPIIAFAAAILVVEANIEQGWVPIPYDMAKTVAIPFIGEINNFLAILVVAILLSLIGFGILTIFYSIIYSSFGPPRYGPLDAPPVRRSHKARR